MKKRWCALLAAVLVLAMGSTVFAAGSPDEEAGYEQAAEEAVGNIDRENVTGTDADGKNIVVNVTPVRDLEYIAASEDVAFSMAKDAVLSNLIDLDLQNGEDITASVIGLVNVEVSSNTKFPVSLTIPVDFVKAGDALLILHYVNGAWEPLVPSEVGNGYVVAEFSTFSPIAVVKVESTEEEDMEQNPADDEETGDDGADEDGDDDDLVEIDFEDDEDDLVEIDFGDDEAAGNNTPSKKQISVKKNVTQTVQASPETSDTPYLIVFVVILVCAVIGLGVVSYLRWGRRDS